MGWAVYEDVRKHSRLELGDKARLLMIELAVCADDDTRICHPGTARLIEITRASRATVFRLMRKICESAEVEQIQRGGGVGLAAEYRIADLAALYGDGAGDGQIEDRVDEVDTRAEAQRISTRQDPTASQVGLRKVSPTRARVSALRTNETPQPPKGGRQRDRVQYTHSLNAWIEQHLTDLDPLYLDRATKAVDQALRAGLTMPTEVRCFLAQYWPQLGIVDRPMTSA